MRLNVLAVRTGRSNPNHHLWNNHGTWFIHYVVHYSDGSSERFRDSLGTKSLDDARRLRDAFFAGQPSSYQEASS
jgi:hypothetical protein